MEGQTGCAGHCLGCFGGTVTWPQLCWCCIAACSVTLSLNSYAGLETISPSAIETLLPSRWTQVSILEQLWYAEWSCICLHKVNLVWEIYVYEKPMWQGEKENVFDVVFVHGFCISNWELYRIINTHDFPHRRCYFAAGQTVLFSWQKQMYQGSLNLDLKVWIAAWYRTALRFYRLLATHHSNFSVFYLGMEL